METFLTMDDLMSKGYTEHRTDEYLAAAKELSDFIKALPLDRPTYDKLLQLMLDQTEKAELSGFRFGLELGSHSKDTLLS